MNFKFELKENIIIKISDERGIIIARGEFSNGGQNSYNVHYQAADGRAVTNWFDESMIENV